jgi:hypothetical protein
MAKRGGSKTLALGADPLILVKISQHAKFEMFMANNGHFPASAGLFPIIALEKARDRAIPKIYCAKKIIVNTCPRQLS